MSEAALAFVAGWTALAVLTYVGYPAAVLVLAGLRPRRPPPTTADPPSVTVIVCAHNEAALIGRKLESLRDAILNWPGAIDILVGDDGSTDPTAAAVEAVAGLPLSLVSLPRGGKAKAINQLARRARGDILVFTDADPLWEPETLSALIAPFADAAVGAVAGNVVVEPKGGGPLTIGDRLFRAYESALRRSEDRLFGAVSADGGLLAIRSRLMPQVPPDATDDFFISTAAVMQGARIAFADEARVFEHSIVGDRQHLRRRVRITVRGLTGLWRRRALMNPFRHRGYAIALIFHKLLRRFLPMFLPVLWVALGVLALTSGEGLPLLGFAMLTAAGLAGWLAYRTGRPVPRMLRLPYFLLLHSAGLAVGAFLFLAGRRYTQWSPQKSPPSSVASKGT